MGEIEPLDDPRVTTGICPDCLVGLQVDATVYELRRWRGVAALIIPGNREDILVRVWRDAGPEPSFVVYPDRRRRQAAIPPVPERRRYRLSFMIAEWGVRPD